MIEVAGQTRHVTSYLRDFMFDDAKMTQRVSTMSGGEQNRLLLAKLFAQTHNFLVLDEPTNDLDLETLELLQEVIADYDGTVLIVSHDRDFLDRTVTAVLAFEGDAKIVAHAGGYSDYLARKQATAARRSDNARDTKSAKKSTPVDKPKPNRAPRLSFKDQHILDTMPALISLTLKHRLRPSKQNLRLLIFSQRTQPNSISWPISWQSCKPTKPTKKTHG